MTENMVLYVMRHGETKDNVANVITAQADSPLTDRGCKQAADKGRLLRQFVSDLDLLAFIASPLHRTCVTMEIARAAAGMAPQDYSTDPRLMEMSFGDWTHRLEGEDRYGSGLPSAHQQWDLQPPSGESQAMVHARVGRFLQSARRRSIIMCHARVLCMIRSHMLNLSPDQTMRYEPPNAGVLRLSVGSEEWLGQSQQE